MTAVALLPTPSVVASEVRLSLSADRKTAARVRISASKGYAVENAFGLPAGVSCPFRTEFCVSCYAESTEHQWSAVAAKMRRNYDALLAAGGCHRALVDLLDALVAPWYVDTVRRGLPLTFRIHWDGDFYRPEYAEAWAAIARAYPDVSFWFYTRSFFAVAPFAGIGNVSVYASVDQYNVEDWRPILAEFPFIHVAACAETFDDAADLLVQLDRRRAPKCPEGVTMPLVVGLSGRPSDIPEPGETGQGACNACRLCIDGRADVRFATNKKG